MDTSEKLKGKKIQQSNRQKKSFWTLS